jgi:Domain of unknown function (DUF4253)
LTRRWYGLWWDGHGARLLIGMDGSTQRIAASLFYQHTEQLAQKYRFCTMEEPRRQGFVCQALPCAVIWENGPASSSPKPIAPLAAVVRSWEDRFGVRVVLLGADTLEVSVAAPPVTTEHALRVAAEHWRSARTVFCCSQLNVRIPGAFPRPASLGPVGRSRRHVTLAVTPPREAPRQFVRGDCKGGG